MKQLLMIKEKLKKFAGKYSVYIIPLLKFLATYIILNRINNDLGYMSLLTNKAITLIIALAGSFLPVNLTIVIIAAIAIAHTYALKLECAVIVLAVFLVMFLLYFRFSSKDTVAALLMPISIIFKVPYVVPVSMGLCGTMSSAMAVFCGTISYYLLKGISVNADSIANLGAEGSVMETFKDMVDVLLGNKDMFAYAIAFAFTVIAVSLIHKLPIKYSWSFAIVIGNILQFIVLLIVSAKLDAGVPAGKAFLGIIFSIILNTILQYFCFDLDYNRTERVQFEDDEYYYYVKAVPKNTIKVPGKKKPASAQSALVRKQPATGHAPSQHAARTSANGNPVTGRERSAMTANHSQRPSSNAAHRAPLGLSGGRPAGEGRARAEARAQAEVANRPQKVIERLSEDELNQ